MGDVRTWTPTVSYLTDDRGEPLMRPARGGMWVSLGDYAKLENALNRAKADKAAVDAMREACAVIAATSDCCWHDGISADAHDYSLVELRSNIVAAIRALPVPAPMTATHAARVPEVAALIEAARAMLIDLDTDAEMQGGKNNDIISENLRTALAALEAKP